MRFFFHEVLFIFLLFEDLSEIIYAPMYNYNKNFLTYNFILGRVLRVYRIKKIGIVTITSGRYFYEHNIFCQFSRLEPGVACLVV